MAAVGFLIAIFSSLIPHFWWMAAAGAEHQGLFRTLAFGSVLHPNCISLAAERRQHSP